jgi:hypothetical protein
MPVIDGDGSFVGIVSLGDLATIGNVGGEGSGEALPAISESPGDTEPVGAELRRAAGNKPARGNETIGG